MKVFQIHPLVAGILFAALGMGFVGLLVVLPLICIQWTWNVVISALATVPQINIWQAILLYLALATTLFLTGLVRIDFEASELD
jgi:hypothetical protein